LAVDAILHSLGIESHDANLAAYRERFFSGRLPMSPHSTATSSPDPLPRPPRQSLRAIRAALHRLFESVDTPLEDTGVGPAAPETVALWVKLVATMGPDELADFEERTFRQGRECKSHLTRQRQVGSTDGDGFEPSLRF